MNIKKKFQILTYNIGFIKKDINSVLHDGICECDIVWMKHSYKDRFFADPFLIETDDNFFYILCEEYIFWEEKGKIALLKVRKSDFLLVDKTVIIEEKTHLSFPCCELHSRTVYPESSASKQYCSYEIDLNEKKVISKRLLLNEGTIDAVFCNNSGNTYLLTGKTKIPSSELYLYKMNENGKFTACFDSPVVSDNSVARSAGNLFTCGEKVFRPVQDCAGRYGRQTKIMEVINIDDSSYNVKEYTTLNSFDNPPFNETMHTFNVYDEIIVVDGSKDITRFPMKIFYRKCPWFFKRREH